MAGLWTEILTLDLPNKKQTQSQRSVFGWVKQKMPTKLWLASVLESGYLENREIVWYTFKVDVNRNSVLRVSWFVLEVSANRHRHPLSRVRPLGLFGSELIF
jgi:hypothetical protein